MSHIIVKRLISIIKGSVGSLFLAILGKTSIITVEHDVNEVV